MNLLPPIYQTAMGTVRDLSSLIADKSQGFGENPALYEPLGIKAHNGIDWPCVEGTPIYASHDGIANPSWDSNPIPGYNRGLGVVIQGVDGKTVYWHLSRWIIQPGQKVKKGDIIGLSGNTGFSSGPHLHFGYKPTDANGNVLYRDNGYDGAVDPASFLAWYPCPDMTKAEVQALQALEGYKDQSGIDYWSKDNKPPKAYLIARLSDKIAELQRALDALRNE